VSERQIMRLVPSGPAGPIRLVYKRPWEDYPPVRRIKLSLSSIPAVLDLGNPFVHSASSRGAARPVRETETVLFSGEDPPGHWDWRDYGIQPPVRDQGPSCGSCWAFGTVGIMETALWKNGVSGVDLSEQFLISCNRDGWGCGGGYAAHRYHYDTLGENQETTGAVLEAEKPYVGTHGTCTENYRKPYALKGWGYVTLRSYDIPSNNEIKRAIYTYGPVTAGVCAGAGWLYYSGGTYYTDDYCGGLTNHQIILVGWDDPGRYWIVRNSWGPEWGVAGYMHLRYGISLLGFGTSWVTTPVYLTVFKAGSGSGSVKSGPSGIDCGTACAAGYDEGSLVSLSASATRGSSFSGWSGDCTGTGSCEVTMSATRSVTATFSRVCSYSLSFPGVISFGSGGGSSVGKVRANGTGCAAPVAGAGDAWLTASDPVMKGNVWTVTITASANGGSSERRGKVFIGDREVTVKQKGATCRLDPLEPSHASFGSTGREGNTISVSAVPSDCEWVARTVPAQSQWIRILPEASAKGAATITYNVTALPAGGKGRRGKITVSLAKRPGVARVFMITQDRTNLLSP
jgi:hypothetical protein